jgi:hypothetical protein
MSAAVNVKLKAKVKTKKSQLPTSHKSGTKHVVVDGKEYTEFISYKGKEKGEVVRVPRKSYSVKWGHVMAGEVLVGPARTTKHGKRRLIVRHRPLAKTNTNTKTKTRRELLPMTSLEHAVRTQAAGINNLHFADEDSKQMYDAHLKATKYGWDKVLPMTDADDALHEPAAARSKMPPSAPQTGRL